jgi:signal transduction histidine kinase
VSLRWRIALGFALVALATAAVIALATPPIVIQGFSDIDTDNDGGRPAATSAINTGTPGTYGTSGTSGTSGTDESETDSGGSPVTRRTTAPPTAAPTENPTATQAAVAAATEVNASEAPSRPPAAAATTTGQAQQTTIIRLILAALGAAAVASLFGLLAAGRLVRPLTRLEQAAADVARGDLGRRSGLADRSDEFGQLGRTFDSMASQLQSADQNRRRFLQDAAHELKTPLAVIDATSSAIMDGVYTPERRHLETIRDQSRILARIVDDLRTISLAEGGHLPLERRPVDARGMLDSVAAGFEARAASASIRLAVEGPRGLIVEADPDRLRQVVGALVDNALRHTPENGSVTISARPVQSPGVAVAARVGTARQLVRLSVEDTGEGIPEEALPRVFERFYQADPSRTRGTGMSGLGCRSFGRWPSLTAGASAPRTGPKAAPGSGWNSRPFVPVDAQSSNPAGSIHRYRVEQARWRNARAAVQSGADVSAFKRRVVMSWGKSSSGFGPAKRRSPDSYRLCADRKSQMERAVSNVRLVFPKMNAGNIQRPPGHVWPAPSTR